MSVVTGSYLIARTLKEEGVDTLFYLTGSPIGDIVLSCDELGIRTIDFRHEQAAAFAAHAHGRHVWRSGGGQRGDDGLADHSCAGLRNATPHSSSLSCR